MCVSVFSLCECVCGGGGGLLGILQIYGKEISKLLVRARSTALIRKHKDVQGHVITRSHTHK